MNPARLFAHFCCLADAPEAIPRLRRFILDLAVRGRLVDQNPKDEPASDLLKRIQSEKERLMKARHLKTPKGLRDTVPITPPHDVPATWIWARFRDVAMIASNLVNPSDFLESTHLAPDNIEKGSGVLLPCATVRADKVISSNHRFHSGQIIYSKIRPNLAKVVVVDFDGLCSADMYPIDALIDAHYLQRYMLSESFVHQALKTDTRVAMPKINQTALNAIAVPVPPLAEQRRIVAKADELMTLCDRLDLARMERESRRDRLVASSLHHLNLPDDSKDHNDFREHAAFHLRHLPRLTVRAEHIQQLRQTILNLAIRGKLVPQDPEEEPAATLLSSHQLFPAPATEPWKLPAGWAWSSYGLLGKTIGGGTPSKANPEFWNGSIPWVSPKDMKVDFVEDSQDHVSQLAVDHSSTRLVPAGSLLIVVRGMILAHSFPAAISVVPVTINQDMKAIVPFRADLSRILLLISKGMKLQILRLVLRSTHGTCKLLTDDLFSLPLPIPPLAEQRRIVAKVEELMTVCDGLEAQLTITTTKSRRVLEAALHEALAIA
jgi:type I restriction enzyme S subunit